MDNGRSPTMSIENRRPKMTLSIILKTRQSESTCIRDRPFNLQGGLWFFVSLRKKISDNTRARIFFFLSRETQICFPEFNIRLYDKYSESDYPPPPPPPHQNQNFFPSNIGNQNIFFLEKKHLLTMNISYCCYFKNV